MKTVLLVPQRLMILAALILVSILSFGQEATKKSAGHQTEVEKAVERMHVALREDMTSCTIKGTATPGVTISSATTYSSCTAYDPTYGTLYADFYTFYSTAGHTYRVTAHSSLRYLATIQDGTSGSVLASTGACGFSQDDCSFTYTMPYSASHLLGFGAFGIGTYQITLSDITAGPPPPTPQPSPYPTPRPTPPPTQDCGGPGHLCLGSRFDVSVTWDTTDGRTGVGHPILLTADTGYFWFFSDTNVELVVKVLDGRGFNGHYWCFYGALSNVHYQIRVRDTYSGMVKLYENPQDTMASYGDTDAF